MDRKILQLISLTIFVLMNFACADCVHAGTCARECQQMVLNILNRKCDEATAFKENYYKTFECTSVTHKECEESFEKYTEDYLNGIKNEMVRYLT